ncbi:MAG: DUF6512 family protein [Fervidobacterium sp.]
MEPRAKKIFKLEFVGFIFIVLAGSLMHFVFEWSGNNPVVAVVAAVNESTWEHLKLAFFPALLYAAFEYPLLKKNANFFFAKVISFYVMPIAIILLFYGYLAVFKEGSLFWDILTFVLAVAAGQFASFIVLTKGRLNTHNRLLSLILFFLIFIPFMVLTYFPIRNFLFRDPITGGFGILK